MRVIPIFALTLFVNTTLKEWIAQPRPFEMDPRVVSDGERGYGLPSGHAQLVVVFWGVIASWVAQPWFWAVSIAVMFLINPWAGGAAVTLEILLYFYLRRQSLKRSWGDARAGVWMALVRLALLRLREHGADPRNWRPHILLFVGDASKRIGLIRLANWFNQDRGLVTACRLIVGDLAHTAIDLERERHRMDRAMAEREMRPSTTFNAIIDAM